MNQLLSPLGLVLILFVCNIFALAEGFGTFSSETTFQLAGNTQDHVFDVDNGAVSVALDKMNVFYIGVDNPISVAASGVKAADLTLSSDDLTIIETGLGTYNVQAREPGNATIEVLNNKTGTTRTQSFRIKRIPDPLIQIEGKSDGLLGSGTMSAQAGLTVSMPNYVFDARCTVQSYTMYYTRKNCDPVEIEGSGARFTGTALQAIKQAKPGDQYAFINVKVRCPGDNSARRVGGMTFKIR